MGAPIRILPARRGFPLLVALCLGLALLAPSARAAQQPAAGELSGAAERWSRLEPAERAELERRFERFQALDEAQRAALRERAEQLREERRSLLEVLPEGDRERLEALPPDVRARILRRQQTELARLRGERLRAALPEPLLESLRDAPPHDRPRMLDQWRDGLREQRLPRLPRSPRGRFVDLPAEELERLRDLPRAERLEALRALSRTRRGTLLPEHVADDPELGASLMRAAIPTVDELIGADGEGVGRFEASSRPDREQLRARARERVLGVLRESGRLDADELVRLEALSADELLRGLRARAHSGIQERPIGPRFPGRPFPRRR